MSVGSVVGVCAVLALAAAPTLPWFLAACGLAGAAMSATLYPPAFAALTQWGGPRRVRALTAVTLVGGLASTVFAPLTAVLESVGSWRSAYALLAVPLAITIVLHWTGLRHPWTPKLATRRDEPSGHGRARRIDPVLRERQFVVLVGAMTLAGFAIYAALINLVPLLVETGFSTQQAAVVLAVGGIGQVAGRIAYAPVARSRVAGHQGDRRPAGHHGHDPRPCCHPEPAPGALPHLRGCRHGARGLHAHPGDRSHRPLGHGVVRRAQRRAQRGRPPRRRDRTLARGARRGRPRRVPAGVRRVGGVRPGRGSDHFSAGPARNR